MITQEIKIYEETVHNYQSYQGSSALTIVGGTAHNSQPSSSTNQPPFSEEVFKKALQSAQNLFKVGEKYKYKSSGNFVEIVAFEEDINKSVIFNSEPGVIVGRSINCHGYISGIYNYTIEEISDMVKQT